MADKRKIELLISLRCDTRRVLYAVVPALLLLSACGGSSDDSICKAFAAGGNSAVVTSRSPGVTVENENLAADGNLSSAAQFYAISGSGDVVFEAIGSGGNDGYAGVLLGLPAGQITQVSVTALRDGAVVASSNAGTDSTGSQVCPGTCLQQNGRTYFGIPVNGRFDTIQANIQVSGTTADTAVYELCTRE